MMLVHLSAGAGGYIAYGAVMLGGLVIWSVHCKLGTRSFLRGAPAAEYLSRTSQSEPPAEFPRRPSGADRKQSPPVTDSSRKHMRNQLRSSLP